MTDTLPDYFLNFWVADFAVAGRFHALQSSNWHGENSNNWEQSKSAVSKNNSINNVFKSALWGDTVEILSTVLERSQI